MILAINPTKDDALKVIRTVLAKKHGRDSLDLWNILTALRGPDNPTSQFAKSATTAVIRRAVMGGLHASFDWGLVCCDDPGSVRQRLYLSAYADHFVSHAEQAFYSLGLHWDEVNPA